MTEPHTSSSLAKELNERVEQYFAWLKDRTILREVPGTGRYVEVTTPHLDRHNDYLQFYVRREDSGYLLTDDGSILDDLEQSGCKLETPKRRQLLEQTLNGFGVSLDNGSIVAKATTQTFSRKKHDLIQAMLAVNDLFCLAAPTVTSLFIEDVTNWLEEQDIRFVSNVKFHGKSGYDHTFEFVIPASRKAPERIIQPINRPNKENAEALAFKWVDTRDARKADTRAYAVLNDQEQSIPSGVADALVNYEITPIPWSQRIKASEELAA